MSKYTPANRLVTDAAHMLVAAQADCVRNVHRSNEWIVGYYMGRRASARFVLKQHAKSSNAGRNRVAAAIREWCAYFHNEFMGNGAK